MAVDFRTISLGIPNGTGPRTIEGTASFGSAVRRAGVALNGYRLDYASSDHHINIIEADTDVLSVSGNTVRFQIQCHYADQNFDDAYSGYVTALVIADVA